MNGLPIYLCGIWTMGLAVFDPAHGQSIGTNGVKYPSSTSVVGKGQTTDLLTFIRALEAPQGYDDFERRIKLRPPKSLTTMTLGEVLDWQKQVRDGGSPSTAAGGYQIIFGTLEKLVQNYKLDRNGLFDAAMQDRLARLLISECGSATGQTLHSRANCLARIWAALPLTSGPLTGYSAHRGVAGNQALTTPEIVISLLAGQAVPLGARKVNRKKPAQHSKPEEKAVQEKQESAGSTFDDIKSAMRGAAIAGSLTPSIRNWSRDPYAVD